MYPYPMMFGGYYMPYYGCPMARFDGSMYDGSLYDDDFYDREVEDGEAPFLGSTQTPVSTMTPAAPMMPETPMMPGTPVQQDAAQPGMQPEGAAQLTPEQQDAFTTIWKQIQADAPQMLNALLSIGASIDTLRQLILRIMEVAEKETKR